jgi:hypothetical protein
MSNNEIGRRIVASGMIHKMRSQPAKKERGRQYMTSYQGRSVFVHLTKALPTVLLCIAFLNGCALVGDTDDSSKRIDLGFALVTLPDGFGHIVDQGDDSPVGRFVSDDGRMVIHYDLGPMAGIYAHPLEKGGPRKEISFRKGNVNRIPYQALISSQETTVGKVVKTLFITYPKAGPANFWGNVETEADIQAMTEAILKLHPRGK